MIITVWPFPTHKRMSVFTVHQPPAPPVDRIDRAESMVFLKDGFTWSAFLLGPLWLLANRLWLATAGYFAVAAFGYLLLDAAGVEEALFGPFLLALNAIVGFEAHWMMSAKLETKGWNTLGSVTGQSLADCERRFFEGWLPAQPLLRRETSFVSSEHAPQVTRSETSGMKPITDTPPAAAAAKPSRRGFAFF